AIGYVFQDARLFPHLSVRGNLEYATWFARGRPERAALDEIVALLALEPLLQRRPHALSGGERQRVAIGRALMARAALLLPGAPLGERGIDTVDVDVDCNGELVRAAITRRSAHALELAPGLRVFAVIKAVAIEPPDSQEWRARRDSNPRPPGSKPGALSS